MKKKLIIITLVFISIIGIGVVSKKQLKSALNYTLSSIFKQSDATIYFPYENLDQIIEITPNIIQCKVVSKNNVFQYDDIDFVKTDIEITDCIRNNSNFTKGQKISILQTKGVNSLLNKDNDLILYIEEYKGPVTDNAYVILGSDYGQYILNGNSIKHATKNIDKAKIKKINADFASIDDLKNKIKAIPYKTPEQIRSEKLNDELNKEINSSEKLKEQQSKTN